MIQLVNTQEALIIIMTKITMPLNIILELRYKQGLKKLCIDFSNNQKLRYVKYHIYGQSKKLLKHLRKSEFITVKIVKNQLKI